MAASIALLVFTDGRSHCLAKSLTSLRKVIGISQFDEKMIVDDSGDKRYSEWLKESCPEFLIYSRPNRVGFCKSIEDAWAFLNIISTCSFVFHIEDDFTYEEYVDLPKMAQVLSKNSSLAQLALLRQPVNQQEEQVGGIYKKHGVQNFESQYDEELDIWWVEHSLFWTTNPSLFKIEILNYGWPTEPYCEGLFGIKLKEEGYKFGFLGQIEDPPKIIHIGTDRVGTGY